MREDKVLLIKEKYRNNIPLECIIWFTKAIEEANDARFEGIMSIPIKSKSITLICSVLFGGLGVDRFYLGDIGIGFTKLICSLVSISFMISSNLIWGLVWSVLIGIWFLIDLFVCLRRYKEINFLKLMSYLKQRKISLQEEYDQAINYALNSFENLSDDEAEQSGQGDIETNLLTRDIEKEKIYFQTTNEQIEILKRLKQVLDEGIITQEDYDKKKAEILNLK